MKRPAKMTPHQAKIEAVAASRPKMRRAWSLSQNPGDDSDHWSRPVSTSRYQSLSSAARLAIGKAGSRIRGSVAASDAFFPFPDAPQLLLEAGVTAIIHPGGSVKDSETTELVNKMNAALVLTGQRHFKH